MLKKLDLSVLLVPTVLVLLIGVMITIFQDQAAVVIGAVRNTLGNSFGVYYLAFGLVIFVLLLYMSFSKIGRLRLGKEKTMNLFTWGALIFTATMAADILFYALHEWMYYFEASFLEQTLDTDSQRVLWSSTYSMFHWGFIPWSFYLVLAAIYSYMFFRGGRDDKQKISEACRPILKGQTDKFLGKLINIIAIMALLFGTATTFSITAPLMTSIISKLLNIPYSTLTSVVLLVIIAGMYATSVLTKRGIERVAKLTTILFAFMIALFIIVGDARFLFESGLQGFGNMIQNFFTMSTWTDPMRTSNGVGFESGFPQDWTIFYWAYWIAWAVATPFFIARISKGRTIRQVLLGGGLAGLLGTFTSFIIFGGFGMQLQVSGSFDAVSMMNSGMLPSEIIIEMISTLNGSTFILILLLTVMFGLYASTFDSITLVMSTFSYKSLSVEKQPAKQIKLFWVLVFIILPISLLFLDTTTQLLMSLAIIGAFPMTIIIILVVISFFKDLRNEDFLDEKL